MNRTIEKRVTGQQTFDGAGVDLVRVLGHPTSEAFDPFLMLDSFDSTEPEAYKAGFPMHPHRGIETISYIASGKMMHRDSLGHEDTISDGEVQWMTAGSGIQHEEKLPASERLLGVQLWLNLPLDYYDVQLAAGASVEIPTDPARTTIAFTLLGDAEIEGTQIAEKTAVKLSAGESLSLAATEDAAAQILVMSAPALGEPIAWHGPIVMNSLADIAKASVELRNGTFLKHEIKY